MTTDIAIYQASVPDRMRYAEALSGASLLPDSYRGKPANVLLALEYGAALGIAPMVAIQGVHVINGKPTASAGLIGALVRKAGHRLRVTGDDRHAVCEITRSDDPDFTFRSEWTMERAQAAKLTGKETWKAYPASMLKARAITEAARDACPEVLAGVNYTAEELGDDTLPAEAYPTTVAAAERPVSSGEGEGSASGVDAPHQPSAATVPDIHDAVVVDETPAATEGGGNDGGGGDRGEATPPPSVDRHAGNRDSGGITDAQLRKLGVMLKDYDRDARLALVSSILGRDVDSAKSLTQREASRCIDELTKAATA